MPRSVSELDKLQVAKDCATKFRFFAVFRLLKTPSSLVWFNKTHSRFNRSNVETTSWWMHSLNIWQVNFDIGILNSADPWVRKKIQVGQAPLELVTHSWPPPLFSNKGNKPPIFCDGTVKTPHFCLRILLLLLVLLAPELITSLANRTKPDFDFLSHHKTRPPQKMVGAQRCTLKTSIKSSPTAIFNGFLPKNLLQFSFFHGSPKINRLFFTDMLKVMPLRTTRWNS